MIMSEFIASFRNGQRDPYHYGSALFVLLVSLVAYVRTVQPTVPYWDCGEFIACAHTLSVPHPPGTPLFMMLGRIFDLLPLGGELAYRVNLLSSVSSAFAVMFAYLITAWIISRWFRKVDSTYKRVTVYTGGIIGALFVAFSKTFWTNAVEAEVYGTSMLIMAVSIYLILKWSDHNTDRQGEKYLLLFSFLSTLALGVHMTSFLVVPIAFLYILIRNRDYLTSFPFWTAFLILCVIPISVTYYLVLAALWMTISALAHYWDHIRERWIYTLAIPAIAFLILVSAGYSWVPILLYCLTGWAIATLAVYRLVPGKKFWRLSFLISLLGLIGFSVQLYTPIRSMHDPVIDMNNPENWDKVQFFLERKQYGQENMITRMFERRGEWANQFGTHERMGFYGFFREQYSSIGTFMILLPLGLLGVFFTIRQRWRLGTFMFLILLAATVGLVLYMNFADGTNIDPRTGHGHLEVRDRDYFFTPGFMIFGMMIGLGVAAVMKIVMDMLYASGQSRVFRKTVLVVLCVSLLLPLTAFSSNFYQCDRSKNYLPFNYAKNILMSCRENAVLFTNGDNDTFPVWCLQYGYGIRPDVRVIVLSLFRTEWYIKQQRDKFDVPIEMSDLEIESLQPYLVNDSVYLESNQVTDNIIDNAMVYSDNPEMWPELPMRYKDFIKLAKERIQADTTLYFDPPIHFSTTVDPNGLKYNHQGMEASEVDAVIEGMVYNIHPRKVPWRINTEFTYDYFLNKFDAEGADDTTFYKDETALRLSENYWKIIAKLADEVYNQGAIEKAVEMNVRAVQIATDPVDAFRFLAKNLRLSNRIDQIYSYMDMFPHVSREGMMEISGRIFDVMLARDINNLRKSLRSHSVDQNLAMIKAAKRMVDKKHFRDYLDFLDKFLTEYPENEYGPSFVEKVNMYVLKYIPPAKKNSLDINFLRKKANVKPQVGEN
ncbi:MAG: DUF2723 domain-containing protein [candidate division Zixibacteria bacterium]|nr:DUF2723 domain-containing protein [candidate division Zixibacteria bacterium]